jgi:hypothetical protein
MGFDTFTLAQDLYTTIGSSWLVHWQYLLMVTLDLKKIALPVLKTNTYKLLYSASHA